MNRRMAGWSLTELMVSLALTGVLVSGGLGAYLQASASYRHASTEQRLMERAQYAFATLGHDLAMAGYFGDGLPPPRLAGEAVPEGAAGCGSDLIAQLHLAVETAATYSLPCAARGGPVAGSHTLTVRRVAAGTAAPRAGRAQWLAEALPPWRRLLLWNGALPDGFTIDPPRTELRDLVVRHYYISQQSDGDPRAPALRVKTLTEIAGRPGLLDTEVMHGIEAMRVLLLPDAAQPRTVRVTLQLHDDHSTDATRPAQQLSISRTFALRNASHAP